MHEDRVETDGGVTSTVRMLKMSERGEDNPTLKTATASAPDEVCLLERVATALSSSCEAMTL